MSSHSSKSGQRAQNSKGSAASGSAGSSSSTSDTPAPTSAIHAVTGGGEKEDGEVPHFEERSFAQRLSGASKTPLRLNDNGDSSLTVEFEILDQSWNKADVDRVLENLREFPSSQEIVRGMLQSCNSFYRDMVLAETREFDVRKELKVAQKKITSFEREASSDYNPSDSEDNGEMDDVYEHDQSGQESSRDGASNWQYEPSVHGLTDVENKSELSAFLAQCEQRERTNRPLDLEKLISPAVQDTLSIMWEIPTATWLVWSAHVLLPKLRQFSPKMSIVQDDNAWIMAFRTLKVQLDLANAIGVATFLTKLNTIHRQQQQNYDEAAAVTAVLDGMLENDPPTVTNVQVVARVRKIHAKTPLNIKRFGPLVYRIMKRAYSHVLKAAPWQSQPAPAVVAKPAPAAVAKAREPVCNGCGRAAAKYVMECEHCKNFEGRNKKGHWQDSEQFKAQLKYMKERKRKGPVTLFIPEKKHKGESLHHVLSSLNPMSEVLKEFWISLNSENFLTVSTLLDSGAIQDNFISTEMAKLVTGLASGSPSCVHSALEATKREQINLGGTSSNNTTLGSIRLNVKFFNEKERTFDIMSCLKFKIFDTAFDLIIGLPTIRKYRLTEKVSSFFLDSPQLSENRKVACLSCMCAQPQLVPIESEGCCPPTNCGTSLDDPLPAFVPYTHPRERMQLSIIAALLDKRDLLEYEIDDDEIVWKEDPYSSVPLNEIDLPRDPEELVSKIHVSGSAELQRKIRSVCREFSDIFSETVRPEPAKIPPMEIKIDPTKWNSAKNRGPPRPQSSLRREVIRKQVALYQKLKVIEPSTASEYSQVHLVPKTEPNDWRFCIDFVRFNEATVGTEKWPIPNILHMLHRIGDKKPKVFGVMDMTSGYHQAPLAPSARVLTAFICFIGLFHWLRVPMGLKNAAAYFQRVMAIVVLVGLLYTFVELYIDDILVFGKTEEEFISNLRQVFARFRQYNITLAPKKTFLGMPQVEYVGHVLSEHGVSFSDAKREKVLNFPLPKRPKDLMAFLGLVNYFREHVRHMSEKVRLLRNMLDRTKKKPLEWSPELEKHYFEVRDEVANCPARFFVSETATIVVMTDASDYGIGAYIYQTIDGQERPIIFMSKALHGAQLAWSVVEKEAYAIFHTLQTYEYLLRDNKFLLKTDHKNLTYLNMEGSPKVKRWKLYIQEFNFSIEHVAGVDNPVADAFSRLCVIWQFQEEDPFVSSLCAFARPTDIPIPEGAWSDIGLCHNASVGHGGLEKTLSHLQRLKKSWKGMREHIRRFIQECPTCQLMNERKLQIKVHPFTTAAYSPMEVLNCDTIGPLKEDRFGFKYIFALIDCFTRWLDLIPMKDNTAESAAYALTQHVGRFGTPAAIRHDGGPEFSNNIIDNFKRLTRMDEQCTLAYSSEENGICERSHKETLRHLRAFLHDAKVKDEWSAVEVPLTLRIFNSETKRSTGVSPAELLFGNAVDLGRHLFHRQVFDANREPVVLTEFMKNMEERQHVLLKVAEETQRKFDSEHEIAKYDKEYTEFPVNSYVLLSHPRENRHKLQSPKEGPFQVVNFVGSTYTIQNLVNYKNFDVHISALSPFFYDENRVNPVEVARRSYDEFVLESILEHRGDKLRRKTMEFKVRWRGYGPEEDSWEPYSALRDTEALLQYLRNDANKLRSLIPNKFK